VEIDAAARNRNVKNSFFISILSFLPR